MYTRGQLAIPILILYVPILNVKLKEAEHSQFQHVSCGTVCPSILGNSQLLSLLGIFLLRNQSLVNQQLLAHFNP